jgi:hypothetical protein
MRQVSVEASRRSGSVAHASACSGNSSGFQGTEITLKPLAVACRAERQTNLVRYFSITPFHSIIGRNGADHRGPRDRCYRERYSSMPAMRTEGLPDAQVSYTAHRHA